MDKKAELRKSQEKDRRDGSEPGVIVAGPEAHARERSGQDPSVRNVKSGDGSSKKPPPEKREKTT